MSACNLPYDQWFERYEDALLKAYRDYIADNGYVPPWAYFSDVYKRTWYAKKPKPETSKQTTRPSLINDL